MKTGYINTDYYSITKKGSFMEILGQEGKYYHARLILPPDPNYDQYIGQSWRFPVEHIDLSPDTDYIKFFEAL